MPITLESRVRRMQVVNLPHDAACRDRCACSRMTVVITAENPRTGDRARKQVAKQVPGSMTWLALERRAGLPRALLEVPDIKAAIACGDLRLVDQTPDPEPAPGAAASTTSVPTGDPGTATPNTAAALVATTTAGPTASPAAASAPKGSR